MKCLVQVDMPVFFYIDPDYVDDPSLEYTDDILLNYTFFEAKKGLVLPSPFERPPQTQQAQIASIPQPQQAQIASAASWNP